MHVEDRCLALVRDLRWHTEAAARIVDEAHLLGLHPSHFPLQANKSSHTMTQLSQGDITLSQDFVREHASFEDRAAVCVGVEYEAATPEQLVLEIRGSNN